MGANTGVSVAASKPKVGGGMYYAPLGTALPTDESTALPAAYKALGPISEDGVQPSRDTSIEKVKEWDGSTLASLLTDESRSFEVVLYGVHDEDVNEFLFGDNATVTAATASTGTRISIEDKGGKPDQAVLVFDMRHGAKRHRAIIPVGDVVITGENPWQGSSLKAYTLTVEALKDDNGVRVYEYLDDGKFTA